jgi:UDP-glucose 4-epimerase
MQNEKQMEPAPDDFRSMNILITGGAGFIGANLTRKLMLDCDVSVVDNLSTGSSDYIPEGITLHRQDILDTDKLAQIAAGNDVIVHLAAFGSVVDSVSKPVANFDINVRGTLSVLEAARLSGVKKVVFASTGGAIMGNTPPPVNEDSLPKPISPYGAGKLCGEAYCHAYAMSYGLETVCLRFANVYGPFSGHKKGVITRFIKNIFREIPFTLYGDGSSSRDYIDVDDLCNGIASAIRTNVPGGSVFHLASGRETSLLQLADHIKKIAGAPEHPCEFMPPRAGEVDRNCADYHKASHDLGFQPGINLEQGLAKTYEWFVENKAEVLSVVESDS